MTKRKSKTELMQYFTPRRVADFAVDLILEMAPRIRCRRLSVIDPSCGEGVFLHSAQNKLGGKCQFTGVDRDSDLLPIWEKSKEKNGFSFGMITGDGLVEPEDELFDVALGNPPFGPVSVEKDDVGFAAESEILKIGRENKKIRSFPIEVLFLERFRNLLKPGGVAALVLPLGIFVNDSLSFVREWILCNFHVLGIVSLELPVFSKEGTGARTCLLFLKKTDSGGNYKVFWGAAAKVDISFNTPDHLNEILKCFRDGTQLINGFPMAFTAESDRLKGEKWDPLYHQPRYIWESGRLEKGGFPIVTLKDLMDESRIHTAYKGPQEKFNGENGIPLVTSRHITPAGIDMTGRDSFIKPGSPPDVKRTRIRPGDVLLVRSGEGCVGRAAVATSSDRGANIRSEIYILRPEVNRIDPYYLTLFLNSFLLNFRDNDKAGAHKANFQICRMARGVGTPNLNKAQILSIKIPLIPAESQRIVRCLSRQVKALYLAARRLKNRDLMDKAKKKAEDSGIQLAGMLEEYLTGESQILLQKINIDKTSPE